MLKKLITLALISGVTLALPSPEGAAKIAADAAKKLGEATGKRTAEERKNAPKDKRRKTPPPKGNKPKANSKGAGKRKGKGTPSRNKTFKSERPTGDFCIQQFNTKEYMYTHTDAQGNKVIALTPKDKAGEIDLKWVWKKAQAGHNTLYGYLENQKRQLGVTGNVDAAEAGLTWNEELSNEMINWFHVEPKTRRINQGHGLRLTSQGSTVSLSKETRTEDGKLNETQDFVAVDCATGSLLDSKFKTPQGGDKKKGGKDTRSDSQKRNSKRGFDRKKAKKARGAQQKNKVKEDL